ncbi:MAG: cytochrome b/b6 domain-containing protein [Aquincola sp.]|nr:cytochrome b/b6 domain-containing protein [Aquincola sp.]
MTSTSTFNPPAADPSRSAPSPGRRVIDAPTRMFHWLFVLSFIGAYATADGERWRALHNTLGYTMAGLLAFRVLYGLFGPRHVRLGALVRKLAGVPAWLRALLRSGGRSWSEGAHARQRHNLLMALAIAALMLTVVPVTLTGYGANGGAAGWFGADWAEDAHAFFGEALLAVVIGHVLLIVGSSLVRRRNLALPMLTGRADTAGPPLVKHDRGALAALLMVAVMAFVGWEWQQSPNGLVPGDALAKRPTPHLASSDPARDSDGGFD